MIYIYLYKYLIPIYFFSKETTKVVLETESNIKIITSAGAAVLTRKHLDVPPEAFQVLCSKHDSLRPGISFLELMR